MKQDYQFCQLKTVDHITCVYLNHPPVNALSEGIRNEIHAILVDAARDQTHALLFLTKDLPFSAGADIKEFSGPMKGKFFSRLLSCNCCAKSRSSWGYHNMRLAVV